MPKTSCCLHQTAPITYTAGWHEVIQVELISAVKGFQTEGDGFNKSFSGSTLQLWRHLGFSLYQIGFHLSFFQSFSCSLTSYPSSVSLFLFLVLSFLLVPPEILLPRCLSLLESKSCSPIFYSSCLAFTPSLSLCLYCPPFKKISRSQTPTGWLAGLLLHRQEVTSP